MNAAHTGRSPIVVANDDPPPFDLRRQPVAGRAGFAPDSEWEAIDRVRLAGNGSPRLAARSDHTWEHSGVDCSIANIAAGSAGFSRFLLQATPCSDGIAGRIAEIERDIRLARLCARDFESVSRL